jgi:hypothetical protein
MVFAISTLVALVLTGCDRLGAYKAAPDEIAALKDQVAKLQSDFQRQQSDLLAMRIQAKIEKNEAAEAAAKSKSGFISREQVPALKSTISECVQQVRASAPDNFSKEMWTGFDAFYNDGAGRVQNNALFVGQQPARYAFEKCMASRGWPLS